MYYKLHSKVSFVTKKNKEKIKFIIKFISMKKNYQIVSKLIIVVILFSFPAFLIAQNANKDDTSDKLYYQWYLNLNGGMTQSFCDIQSGTFHLNQLQSGAIAPAFGLRLGKHVSPVFGIYGSYMTGKLKGFNDKRDLRFETNLWNDVILGGTVSFSNLIFGYKPRIINVYGTAGIGLANFTPTTYKKSTDQEVWDIYYNIGYNSPKPGQTPEESGKTLADGKTEVSNTHEALVPTGIGVDFRLNNRWDINLETTLRWFNSDKLDGYKSGEKNDAYYYTSLGVGYSFWRPKEGGKMKIETEPNILALHGDSIPVEINGTFPDMFNKKTVVDFTPVLKYGDKSVQLPTMYFNGEEVPAEYQKEGAVAIPSTGGSFTYRTYVKYEPGMDVCALYVNPMASVKGKTPYSMGDRKIADGLIMTSKRFENNENLLLADHGYKRDIIVSETGIIYYLVNKYDVNLNFKLNKDAKAKEMLTKLNDFVAKGWEMKNIEINAWASPEGEESFNQGLSQKRAESAQTYMQGEYRKYIQKVAKAKGMKVEDIMQEIKFNLAANGEDWDGFMQAIQKSNIKDKNIIANVVNSQPDPNKREQEIRNMTVIYKEIEDEILPPLRRSEIKVNCLEPSKTDDEIAKLATTSPDSLNINDLLYAATLTKDANAQFNIYKSVIEKYPNDWRGYNNAGYACAELKNFDLATNYFAKAKSIEANNGLILNNMGAMESKAKDFKKAKADYLAAQKQGVDVNYNMGIVKIAEGNYNGAINSFGSTKCDYNLALAHTLSGNYNAATATLNCAEKTPKAYYLMAIIGARTNNDNMVFENLKKAISGDESYKDKAKDDMEFLKYYSNPDFQNAIK